MPPGHWHEIAATIAQSRTSTLEQNARLFALISLAQADAAIVCWETKYRYNLWRPVTAIRRSDEDGNPATVQEATWDHYLVSPPFPAYTSGHSTFSKASAEILTHFYGTDSIEFSATSDSLPGVFRHFTSLAGCADEIGMSRIYGGIHYQFDNQEGKTCGKRIADHIAANYLLPNSGLPRIRLYGVTNGSATVQAQGHFGATVVLESSTDLKNWQPVQTNSITMGGVMMTDSAHSGSARFYRVSETEGNP